ncbi:MAG: transposase [bacterium]|nr:transposase [bacterium]
MRCSCCGNINPKLSLTDRTSVRTTCGMVNDRDVNAAIK